MRFSSYVRAFAIFPLSIMTVASMDVGARESCGPSLLDWPKITKESRPWTRWWWMGSAVDRAELTRHLRAYHEAGIGGVEIVPIYGVKGYEDRYIRYLTPAWMDMVAYTVSEASELGMGVDMATGTGWPFGGPWVGPEDAAAKVFFEVYTVAPGEPVEERIRARRQPQAPLQALVAFSETGDVLDLTERVDTSRKLDWLPTAGRWKLYAVFLGRTGQQVKRAAPGGEGNVVDHFSSDSLSKYLARFDEAFAGYRDIPIRAFFNDSYEVYGANWTGELFNEFKERRGYDLRNHLPALLGEGPEELVKRVRSDYRATIADLLLEQFTESWVKWAHKKGCLARNQAHGSPGNLLDLYAAADIPETEGFGPGGSEILMSKFASSAAHLTGKQFVSSESCTWLGEHFQVSLAQVKPEIDKLFLAGINHVFFHGMAFSPADVGWPGWLFYASTEFGPSNSFWRDLPELNAYIARCQSFLQAGRPDPDVLLYFPIYDLWSQDTGTEDFLHYLRVHNTDTWFKGNLAPFHRAAQLMWERGYAFDYVSDRLLAQAVSIAGDGSMKAGGASYRALVLAGCQVMQPETFERVIALAEDGATVIFAGGLPQDVPGLEDLAGRRQRFERALGRLAFVATGIPGIREARVGKGRFLLGDNLESMLEKAGIRREILVDWELEFIRRAHDWGYDYFLVNRSDRSVDGWVPVRARGKSVVIFDPYRNRHGVGAIRDGEVQGSLVRLQLGPGESCFLRILPERVDGPRWCYLTASGAPHSISGLWEVTFIEGGPSLPRGFQSSDLASWTDIGGPEARVFSGTARYTIVFEKPPEEADEWVLDLGNVHESARVKVNGHYLGTLWCPPYHIAIGKALHDGENLLEVEVTNLMANRIADMDRRGVPWKSFYFVSIDYKDFDASLWSPVPSGLLGPVRLIPQKAESVPVRRGNP